MKQLIQHLDPNKKVIIHDLDDTHLLVDANYVKVRESRTASHCLRCLAVLCSGVIKLLCGCCKASVDSTPPPTPNTNNRPNTNHPNNT